ncbi:MAG: hypothetical protein K9J12_18715 [Melioribacteraceae bacterium]|nr:hypothetical protein [Melioribacteraceae bacterium]MCF8264679.1 hypothetical protein [Melioribacteraceae bacterium]MCF8413456.1 hypothetical protein [Melioribacteraceae bacterium]MCF8431593.1 hypothetical protein [Melioribacteraceae bacterium]
MKLKLSAKLAIVLMMMFAASIATNAQSVKEKIKSIKGDVNKITINVDGEDVVFEGEEAEKLFKQMKKSNKKTHGMVFSIPDIDVDFDSDEFESLQNFKVKIVGEDGDSNIVWVTNDDDDFELESFDFDSADPDEGQKIIKFEKEDGNSKLWVKTKEDGEIKTEAYEGKEAEEYLENLKDEDDIHIEFESDEDDKMFIWKDKHGAKIKHHDKKMNFLLKKMEDKEDGEIKEVIIKKVKSKKKDDNE